MRLGVARRALVALAVAGALLAARWTVAWAHAGLVSAEPAAGSHLASSPTRVRLVFSEPLEPTLARLTLLTTGGAATRLAARGDPTDVHALVAPTDVLPAGAYRLAWRIVSADGHPVEGSYTFSVGATAAVAPVPDVRVVDTASVDAGPAVAGAPLLPSLLRGLAVGGLMALGGVLLFVAWPGERVRAPRRAMRLARWLAVATPLALAAHLAAWLAHVSPDHRLTSDWAATALASGVGRLEVWRVALAGLALWALGLARRPRLALLFAAAALVVSGATGHAAAIDPRWAIPAKALHLLAGAAWLGGLLWLLAHDVAHDAGVPNGGHDDGAFVAAAGRVSTIALVAVLVVTITGAVQALLFLPSPLDLVRSAYGAVTLAKVAGLLVLVAFGAYHRRRVLPRLAVDRAAPRRFHTTLRREVVVMTLVVLLGGLLAYVPPPVGAGR